MPLCCFLSGLGRPSFIILAVGEGHSTLSVLLTRVYVELQSLLGSLFLRKSVTNFSLIEIATQLCPCACGGVCPQLCPLRCGRRQCAVCLRRGFCPHLVRRGLDISSTLPGEWVRFESCPQHRHGAYVFPKPDSVRARSVLIITVGQRLSSAFALEGSVLSLSLGSASEGLRAMEDTQLFLLAWGKSALALPRWLGYGSACLEIVVSIKGIYSKLVAQRTF